MICLEAMEAGQGVADLRCTHSFHTECILDWLSYRLKSGLPGCCPNCNLLIVEPILDEASAPAAAAAARWHLEERRLQNFNRWVQIAVIVFIAMLVISSVVAH
jgi:hypothetical protein